MPLDLSRHPILIQSLADQAIDAAVDAAPHRPRAGQTHYSLVEMLPHARALLGSGSVDPPPPPTQNTTALTDGRGHQRPVYRHLAAYLHHRVTGVCVPVDTRPTQDVSLQLWSCWHRLASGRSGPEPVHRLVEAHAGSLHPQSPDETPDHWTYRELVGLHALQALIEWSGNDPEAQAPAAWTQRRDEVTAYHQHHTQPDYTTYQPWALAAFLSNPNTVHFAEQQLHDAQTHLAVEGGPGAVLPALLLADAYASITR